MGYVYVCACWKDSYNNLYRDFKSDKGKGEKKIRLKDLR